MSLEAVREQHAAVVEQLRERTEQCDGLRKHERKRHRHMERQTGRLPQALEYLGNLPNHAGSMAPAMQVGRLRCAELESDNSDLDDDEEWPEVAINLLEINRIRRHMRVVRECGAVRGLWASDSDSE